MQGNIFISYRRNDDAGFAGRLFDQLESKIPRERLFIDVNNIPPGHDFVRVLQSKVDECDVLLAVIGPNWVEMRDANGLRRLDDPMDFVRIEIESGLGSGKFVIPVLVNDAKMPRAEQLPDGLKPLARRQAIRLMTERFRVDVQHLVDAIARFLVLPEAERQAITAAEATASKLQKETPERLLVDVNALLAKIKQSDCEFQDGVDRFNDAISKANRHMAEADRGLDDVLVDMHWGTVMGRTLLIVLVLSVPAVWFGGWWLGIAVTILAAPAVYFLVRKLFLRALGNSAH